MARGWESKAVADQMEEADVRELDERAPPDSSPAVRERRERLESLRLSRALTLAQLERATGDAHRKVLTRTLRALESEMAELE